MTSPKNSPSPDSFTETYFQITPDILASFPKFRPPMDLYLFKEAIAELVPFSYAGQRLSQAQLRELHEECANGNIFVARSDRHIYAQHISKQLDLILMDSKLKESEIAHILSQGLTDRFRTMFAQPVKTSLELVQADLAILVQYLTIDPFRIKSLLRALPPGQDLEHRAYHTTVCGLALSYELLGAGVKPTFVRDMSLGLAMTPLGLCKIPAYIRNKKGSLTPDEQKSFLQHPLIGAAQLKKLGVREETTLKCVLEHQESLDGSGFPQKLTQESISQAGRISAVASAFASHFSAPEPLPARDILAVPSRLSQESPGLDPHLINLLQTVLNSVYKTPSREGT